MKTFIKQILYKIIYFQLRIKCRIHVLVYGANGLGRILERVPEVFIIPLMKKYGLKIGEDSRILPGIVFNHLGGKKPFENLIIGKNVYIGRNVLFDLTSRITLSDDSALGAGSQVWTHVGDYTYDFSDYHATTGPVLLGKGVLCWSRVIIVPGVTIGNFSRVAVGSIVIKNVEEKSFVGGVPAKFIKKRDI